MRRFLLGDLVDLSIKSPKADTQNPFVKGGFRPNSDSQLSLQKKCALISINSFKVQCNLQFYQYGDIAMSKREQAIASGAVDLVGLGRAMALNPRLAKVWLTGEGGDPEFPIFESPPRGGVTAWYTMRITALGEDSEDSFTLDPHSASRIYEERDSQRCTNWQEKY
jgi:hypothetical protein